MYKVYGNLIKWASVWPQKIQACLCVFLGTKAVWCSLGWSDRPFTFCGQGTVIKESDGHHFVPALLWLESKVQLVWMLPCSLPQGMSPESTRFKGWASYSELLEQANGKWKFS